MGCPAPTCSGRFLAPPSVEEVRCPTCHTVFCSRCGNSHRGMTCSQYSERMRQGDGVDKELEELIKQQCWQRCPCCKAACEREEGCNFITCHSEICRGKKYFCYLCGKELSASEHFTHFPHGLFENACCKIDRRDDAILPKPVWTPGV